MRPTTHTTYAAAAVLGAVLVGGGIWWKTSDGTAPVEAPAVEVSVAEPVAPVEAPSVVPSQAPAVVPEVVVEPEEEVEAQALADIPSVPKPVDTAEPQEVVEPVEETPLAPEVPAEEVFHPSEADLADPIVLEEPEFVEEAMPEPEVQVHPDREHLGEFVRVSLLVFARNDAYLAAIARAEQQADVERQEALRFEMAKEANAVIAAEFPWGVARYVELAEAVRNDPALEQEAAALMEAAVR